MENNDLHEFQRALDERLRGLADARDRIEAAMRLLGERLGASQAGFCEVDPDRDEVIISRDWTDGRAPSMAGVWRPSDFGHQVMACLRRGEPVAIANVREDPRTNDPAALAAFEAVEARAILDLPLMRDGRLVAVLFVNNAEPRSWREADELLAEIACARMWEAVQRAHAEAELSESREELALAVEAARMGVFDWDPATDRLSLSEISLALLGVNKAELSGDAGGRLIHPDDRLRHADAVRAAYERRGDWRIEYRVVRPDDGRVVWIEERGHAVAEPISGRVRMKGVHWDATARKEAEEKLRSTFEIKTVGIVYWDPSFTLTDVNEAFLRITGFTREEAIGLSWAELTPPEFHAVSHEAIAELAVRGEATPYEKQYFRKDGSRWWGLLAPRRVNTHETVEFVLDVTERREAEDALRRLKDNLEQRVAEEVAARMNTEEALRQAQKMEAIGQLTGGVAHDFNNLLTIIRSSTDFLRREGLPPERAKRYVEAIADTTDRAAKLTGQLLAFARRQALLPEVFDVPSHIRDLTDMLRTVVGAHVEIVADIRCDACSVEADLSQFETALVNMAVNARDAMQGQGRLTIKVEALTALPPIRGHAGADGQFVAITLADTGAGIAPDVQTKVFEPFFTTKEVGKGTGLGLSQVFGFAKQSGGDVAVRSRAGEGAAFTIYLPRVAAAPKQASQPRADRAAPQDSGRGRRVLLVEDNVQVGRFSAQLLEDLGYKAVLAENAEQALEKLSAAPDAFDVVFSDVVMPGASGVELGREIRRRWPGLPVVLTSGYSHVLADEGAHGFELLHKPYAPEDLFRVLRRVSQQA